VLFFRRKVNPSTHAHAALVCVVYLAAVINCEGEVLDSDVLVAVLATICLSKPQACLGLGSLDMILPEAQVEDVLLLSSMPKCRDCVLAVVVLSRAWSVLQNLRCFDDCFCGCHVACLP
jgi:hypothetical protein